MNKATLRSKWQLHKHIVEDVWRETLKEVIELLKVSPTKFYKFDEDANQSFFEEELLIIHLEKELQR